jgi:hypothetical protein
MKHILTTLAFAIALCAAPAPGATWNDAFGMGNPSDDSLFNGAGVLNGTVGNNRTNFLYYVTSAKSSGAPRICGMQFWSDATRPFAEVWVPTNAWTCISNQPAGTNTLWLQQTNSGITTNDLLIHRDVNNDCYQLVMLGGDAGSGALKLTNAAGHNGISLLTATTNPITSGDVVYKLTRVQQITPTLVYPLGGVTTNAAGAVITNYFKLPQVISGRQGLPLMVGIFATNPAVCWMNVQGEYILRPRR